jgi:predicted MPP superfamily phosphohydrolase
LAAKNAETNQEIAALARDLLEAIKAAEADRNTASKYRIDAQDAQVAVIGDGARIEGGIHNYYGGTSKGNVQDKNISRETTDQGDEDDSVLMHILHLSDLHFGTEADAKLWSNQLGMDLKQELFCDQIDAMIISGDVGNIADKAEYQAAKIFIERICERFSIDRSHLVIVPGNHDLNWKLSKKGYVLKDTDDLQESLVNGEYIEVSKDVVRLKQLNLYQERFSPFSCFYEMVKGAPYPLEAV